ncbi:hypothetical protein GCM10009609_43880 [Pseudonocardia aurantiaca]|uniref:Uncharacterized protein n=1 Tax=Pseudonocardia aurantiaca TaxID=75290 RepID=A0ABW4FXZ7_9PSEU
MTITLPKPLRTYQYRPLTVFSMLDTDTDRVLPQLFEMCVKGGRSSRSKTNAGDFAGYRDAMLDGGWVVGFAADGDRALLDGWLRSCVVDMGTVGRSGAGEQMLGVAPLTLAAYRAGLPKDRTRHAGIDDAVYQLLLDAAQRGAPGSARTELRELVARTLGRGLVIGPEPRWEPRLTDVSQLDIGALLEFRFLEGVEMGDALPTSTEPMDNPLPAVAADLGGMLLAHIRVYGDRLPVPSLMSSFAALMAVGLFAFSLRVSAAARELLRTGELPADMRPASQNGAPPSPLELYCDFTGDLGSVSDGMARRCVERDLDRVRLAFRDRMTFVVVDQALSRIPAELERREALSRPERLAQLASLRSHRRVESYAEGRIDDLVADSLGSEQVTDPEQEFLRATQSRDVDELSKLLDIMEFVNQSRATNNSVKWFRSVGGIAKPYGVLRGTSTSRRSWRYAPGEELLTALLLAVFVDPSGRSSRREMALRDVLDALEHRFGILVDRPPAFLDGAEARAAAAANLEAFKARLQLLGCFDSLSDDFSVQIVRHPLGDA